MRNVSVPARAWIGLISAWLAATLASACGDGSTDSARASAPEIEAAPVCELPGGGYPGSCNECLAARCCAPIEACKGRAECAAQLDCMIACQYASAPPECSRGCLAAGREPDYVAYDDCSFEDCRDACWL